jgi:hypothetical protein
MPSPSDHPLVKKIQAELMPVLREALPSVAACSDSVRVFEFGISVGSATPFQGFSLGLSCLWLGVPETEPDEVSLAICVCHLDHQPLINIEVDWGYTSGQNEAEFSSAPSSEFWPLATPEVLREIGLRLPQFIESLRVAARRGHP